MEVGEVPTLWSQHKHISWDLRTGAGAGVAGLPAPGVFVGLPVNGLQSEICGWLSARLLAITYSLTRHRHRCYRVPIVRATETCDIQLAND
ncbi:hypothetical protein J6590_028663 [Homalodisca vitripennis]|nr:hypothetical protein J6590_028663 [Homalodisca vitripennis]